MFDWNDEELTNIIWGEAGESEDHIVPYPEGNEVCRNKRGLNQEAKTTKPTEQKTSGVKVDLYGRKLESSSNYTSNEGIPTSGFEMGSWPDLSSSNAAKPDQDSMGTEVSKSLAEKYSSKIGAETAEIDKNNEIFQSSHEGKEQGDLVDYSWANIGSFDDLDRIFSNDDPLFGNVSLGSADELWSSSKDVINSPPKYFPLTVDSPSIGLGALGITSENLDNKTENEQQENQPFTLSYGELSDPSSHGPYNANLPLDHGRYPGGKYKPTTKEQADGVIRGNITETNHSLAAEKVETPNELVDKPCRQKKLLKFRKKSEERSDARSLQDLYRTWTPSRNPLGQLENQLEPAIVHSSSSVLNQQRQLQGTETSQYQSISNPFMATSVYGNLTNPYPAMPVLSAVQPAEFKNQLLHPSYEVSPGPPIPLSRSTDAPSRPLTMTPREKIEKLRRRQQMQAMLAIQRQQQQFSHQVAGADHPVMQKSPQDSQIQLADAADLEDLSTLPSFDQNSPTEHDDSNTISVAADDYSAEESVLYRLQDVVAKLDMNIRLCIRDSLFRLAQSAMQRHYPSDTSSSNRSSRDEPEAVAEEEAKACNRYMKMPDAETETNPIDRTVAHLLFHRPLELSGKHPETPESPASAKLQSERKTMGIADMQLGYKLESSKMRQSYPQEEDKSPPPLADRPESLKIDIFETSPCMNISENASNYGSADVGAAEAESSQ